MIEKTFSTLKRLFTGAAILILLLPLACIAALCCIAGKYDPWQDPLA